MFPLDVALYWMQIGFYVMLGGLIALAAIGFVLFMGYVVLIWKP